MNQSSIVLNLEPIMATRNIKTKYTYLRKNGVSGNAAQRMLNGTLTQLTFSQLTSLCVGLNCTPNDILATRDLALPDHHALQSLKKFEPEKVVSITNWLANKTIEEIEAIMKNNE
ncbi:hypothetical protein FAQ01_04610 [Flavobacterium aquatile]|nr:hypothetical protein FAQ01_04610 [Flavobacterium aquatile]